MRMRISRLPPHQNGKIFGILLAVTTLIVGALITTSLFLASLFATPGVNEQGEPRTFPFFLFLMPFLIAIVYSIVGYLSVLIGCGVYNVLHKYIGGFEFEHKDGET